MRVPVDHEIKELGPEIDVVDQGASLGCGAIGSNPFSRALELANEAPERITDLANSFREPPVVFELVDLFGFLDAQEVAYGFTPVLGGLDKEPQ